MRFKTFINEDLTMQGTGQTSGITGGSQTAQTGQQQMGNNPMMNNPAMQRIMKSLDTINKDSQSIPNPMNKNAIKNATMDFQTMLKQGPNDQNKNNIAKRNINNVKTGVNVPNRTNMPNQQNIDPQLGNNVNAGN